MRMLPCMLPRVPAPSWPCKELGSAGSLTVTASQLPGSHPKPLLASNPLFGAASHIPCLFVYPLPGSCLVHLSLLAWDSGFPAKPRSLGEVPAVGWSGRDPDPPHVIQKRLSAGPVHGTEFHVCFLFEQKDSFWLRKSLQASKAGSNPEQLLPSPPSLQP